MVVLRGSGPHVFRPDCSWGDWVLGGPSQNMGTVQEVAGQRVGDSFLAEWWGALWPWLVCGGRERLALGGAGRASALYGE